MIRFGLLVFLAFGLTLISCKNDTASETQQTEGETMEITTPQEIPSMDGGAPAGNLNPAHGQPGHRCDIAVGAPLDGPTGGGDGISPVIQSQPMEINTQPAAQPATGGSGNLNPPHGQPGHRCDIAVGAPLN